MRVVFDVALDRAAWPGPLGHADHTFGEAWVGQMGLLDLLETRLGLGGLVDDELRRACRLAARLQGADGYWRRSFEVDPLGTCRRLLSDRDQLRLGGWQGQAVSRRLGELQEATTDASTGLPDRLEAIIEALPRRSTGVETLVSYTAFGCLPKLWRHLFASLRDSGVHCEERSLPESEASGDLQGVRAAKFSPVGDGRLCLLRGHGPLEVADEVAAALAASGAVEDVVLVGADEVLDQALGRHGLPRVGGCGGAPSSFRLLELVVSAAFHPMRASDLHALLAAEPGPIPRPLAVRLIEALRSFPGRRTEAWEQAFADGLGAIDADKRDRVEQRARTLLWPTAGMDEPLAVAALRSRLEVLATWARSRARHVPSLLQLSTGVRTLLDAVELLGSSSVSRRQLRRLCDDLGEPTWAGRQAEAGLGHVDRPGAVMGPARVVVWWGFSRGTEVRPNRMLLSRSERDALHDVGAEPPDPSREIEIEVRGWQRPLLQARDALVLACPTMDASGQPSHPHPLWDDVVAKLSDHREARKLERSSLELPARAASRMATLRPLPSSAAEVSVAAPVTLRETESPSSIEKLLGCSMAWLLDYRARLSSKVVEGPPPVGPLVFGSIAHRILEEVLPQSQVAPDRAAALAAEVFDRKASNLCEDLGMPQHQSDRASVRRAVVESARELVRLAIKHNVQVVRTEVPAEVVAADQRIRGRLDLVWGDPTVVLDLKWGKSSQVNRLQSGTAIQLAAYAAMQVAEGRAAETAYFVLLNQQLLPEPGGLLAADGRAPGQHGAAETWSAAVASMRSRRDALAAGRIEAPGAEGQDVCSAFAPTGLTISPPCGYCRYAGICGRGGAR